MAIGNLDDTVKQESDIQSSDVLKQEGDTKYSKVALDKCMKYDAKASQESIVDNNGSKIDDRMGKGNLAKKVFKIVIYTCMVIIFGTTIYEYYCNKSFVNKMNLGKTGFPEGSCADKLAKSLEQQHLPTFNKVLDVYSSTYTKPANRRLNILIGKFMELLLILVVSIVLFNETAQRKVLNMLDRRITILGYSDTGIKTKELNLVTIVIFVRMIIALYQNEAAGWNLIVLNIIICMTLNAWTVRLMFKLRSWIGYKVILFVYALIACIGTVYHIFLLPSSLLDTYPYNCDSFSPKLQNCLRENNLYDKVFIKNPDREVINGYASGFGKDRFIIIDGNPDLSDSVEGTVAHEIGHCVGSCDKLLLFYTNYIICAACLMTLFIYWLSTKSSENSISPICAWTLMDLISIVCIFPFIGGSGNFMLQREEFSADKYAFDQGFGTSLQAQLFYYHVRSGTYMYPSYLYNLLDSTHPSPYERIRRLAGTGETSL